MNEFSAKKLGEVLAFSLVGRETAEKSQKAFTALFEDGAEKIVEKYRAHAEAILSIAHNTHVSETVSKKAEATAQKLRNMRDLYIGDEWDNPSEIAEWLGFFEGAAIIHWALVEGVSAHLTIEELRNVSLDATGFHNDLLQKVKEAIKFLGKEKSQN
jgi:hypothetical protein